MSKKKTLSFVILAMTTILSISICSSFVFAYEFVDSTTANDFKVDWYIVHAGITNYEYEIHIKNLQNVKRGFNLEAVISEIDFPVNDMLLQEYKQFSRDVWVDTTTCENIVLGNGSTSESCTPSGHYETEYYCGWKPSKMGLITHPDSVSADYGVINIPKSTSLDDCMMGDVGTKVLRLSFNIPLIETDNGWGSSGKVALWSEGFEYHPFFNTSWSYRKNFTILSSVSGDVTIPRNFTLDTAALITAGKMLNGCTDLRMTNESDLEIPFYIESGCGTTKTIIWYKTDTKADNTSVVWIYYGNKTEVATGQNENGVYSDNYLAVWDMSEGTGTGVADSTSNTNDATITGGSWAAGITGNASAYDGASGGDYMRSDDKFSTGLTEFTATGWFWIVNTSADLAAMFQKGTNSPEGREWSILRGGTNLKTLVRNASNEYWTDSGVALAAVSSAWHHFVSRWNGTYSDVFIDGALKASTYISVINTYEDYIYAMRHGTYTSATGGYADNLRLSSDSKSNDYIKMEHDTMTISALTGALGAEQAGSNPTSMSLWLDGVSDNKSYSYTASSLNITAQINVTGLWVAIDLNGTNVVNSTTTTNYDAVLGAGTWNITAYYDGNASYTTSSKTWYVIVSQAANPTTLCLANSTGTWCDGTQVFATYPSTFNASCFGLGGNLTRMNVTDSNYTIFAVNAENNTFVSVPIATWLYNCTASGNANYSYNMTTANLEMGKGVPVLNLTLNSSTSVQVGTWVNITCTANSAQITPLLFNDTGAMTNPAIVNMTAIGIYNYTCNSSAVENWTAGSNVYTSIEVTPNYVTRILLIEENTGEIFSNFGNMSILRAVTENEKILWNFLTNNTTSFYYTPNISETIMIQKQYVGSDDVLYVDIVSDILDNDTIRVCVASEQQFYEVILYSSSVRGVLVKNNYADCYVTAGYTRFAYSNAFMNKIYTKQDLYYIYLFNSTNQPYLLTRLDGSSAIAVALDVLEFNQRQTSFSLIPEDFTIEKTSNTTLKFYYRNEKSDSEIVTIEVYNGASKIWYYEENVTPNDFYVTFNWSSYGLAANATLRADAVIERTDGSTDTISRVFMTSGNYGIIHPMVAIASAFFLLFFGLTMVASRYALGYFGIIIEGISLAVTTFSPVTDAIRLSQAVILIMLVYTILVYREENLHIT